MTFPGKDTRAVCVDAVQYIWHLNRRWETKNSWIVIAKKGCENNQLLFLDPYHHDILPTRKTISSAIQFALVHGWDPSRKGMRMRLAYDGHSFEILTEDGNNWEHHRKK
ncbi:MAG: hypothetical protein JXA73_11395 [Acidobacteria bacterium]|nr:hypothetical protein [Acidobacteriota bacterium]